jgi:hypothetical protein
MKYLILIPTLLTFKISGAQTDSIIKQFDSRANTLNRNGIVVLSSWASANIIGSAVGYSLTKSNEEKDFYMMNASWGVINLGLALPSLLSKEKSSASIYDLQKKQTKTEKIFLANALLDVAYITSGFYLKEYASHQTDLKKQERFTGFGNSIVIQGAGLMVFDIAMTILNNRNRKKHLDPFLKKASFSFSGNYVKLGYKFN